MFELVCLLEQFLWRWQGRLLPHDFLATHATQSSNETDAAVTFVWATEKVTYLLAVCSRYALGHSKALLPGTCLRAVRAVQQRDTSFSTLDT